MTVRLDVDLNLTVEMPDEEYDELEEDDLDSHLEENVLVQYVFGNAWVTTCNRVELIEREPDKKEE